MERRLLRGETIPHEEKVFSIFEEHTRWVFQRQGGHAGRTRGPVAIIEDQYGFILHHKVLWEGEDVDVAVSMVQEAQALYRSCGRAVSTGAFIAATNRVRLDALLDVNALPGRGYLSRADREREEEESFVCRAACASGDRVCHQWVGASGTRPSSQPWCGRLRAYGWPCRCWRPTCIASG